MTKFESFYEVLCRAVVPALVTDLIFIAAGIYRIFKGKAFTDGEFYTLIAIVAVGLIIVLFWAVCSFIRHIQLKRGGTDEG
jgi:hypothetical protein